jgi:integrase
VREKLTAATRALDQGEAPIAARAKVGDFLDRWLRDVVKPNLRPKSYRSYEQLVRLYLNPALGHLDLAKLQPQHVQAMLNQMRERGLSPRTCQYARAVLRKALNQALRWGLVAKNAAALADPPKAARHEIRPLDPAEARRFLDAARGNRLEALYRVTLSLGLRQGEILGLQWADADLDAGTLAVRRQLQRVDGAFRPLDLKTAQSHRRLALPAALLAALREHRRCQLEERLLAGER